MNIGSIGTSSTQAIQTTFQQVSSSNALNLPAVGSDSSSVSGPGQLLAKLKDLQKSDPAKFKEVMSGIVDKLNASASSATDPQQKKFLTELADKFKAAGDSGDLSKLAPSHKGGHAHGHRPAGPPPAAPAQAASSSSSSATQPDPADTNGDGTVSDEERQAYAAKEAAQAAASSSAQRAYGQLSPTQGGQSLKAIFSSINAFVDTALQSNASPVQN